jgi:hypothetical protein
MLDGLTGFDFSTGQRPHRALVTFYLDKMQNNFKSEQEGRPVFDDKEMIRIITPGDTKSVIEAVVKMEHKLQYAREYEAFQKGMAAPIEGTPLEEWPPMTPATVANLKAANIHTVEQLAEVHDGLLANLGMGGRTLRDKAKNWLENAAGGAVVSRLQAENETLKAQQEVQAKTIAELSNAVARLQPSTKQPGEL